MEVGIPWTLSSQDAGDIVFNVLDGSAFGLPDGNGLLLTDVIGADSANVRNPTHNKAHSDGVTVHRFERAAKIISVAGKVVCTTPENGQIMADAIRACLEDMLIVKPPGQSGDKSGRIVWTPAGTTGRFHFVHLYQPLDVTSNAPGTASPKTFTFTVVSDRPEALGVIEYATPISDSGTAFIPNAGNTETWPVIHIPNPTVGFAILTDAGYGLTWEPNTYSGAGTFVEVDMFYKTLFWDGDGDNAMSGLAGDFGAPSIMDIQDFFPIPAGGMNIKMLGASATIYTSDAWVG